MNCGSCVPKVSPKSSHTPAVIRLLPNGYRISLLFLNLFDKIYAPLTAGLLHPYPGDRTMTDDRLHQLDKLYQSVRCRRVKACCLIQSLRERSSRWGPDNGLN